MIEKYNFQLSQQNNKKSYSIKLLNHSVNLINIYFKISGLFKNNHFEMDFETIFDKQKYTLFNIKFNNIIINKNIPNPQNNFINDSNNFPIITDTDNKININFYNKRNYLPISDFNKDPFIKTKLNINDNDVIFSDNESIILTDSTYKYPGTDTNVDNFDNIITNISINKNYNYYNYPGTEINNSDLNTNKNYNKNSEKDLHYQDNFDYSYDLDDNTISNSNNNQTISNSNNYTVTDSNNYTVTDSNNYKVFNSNVEENSDNNINKVNINDIDKEKRDNDDSSLTINNFNSELSYNNDIHNNLFDKINNKKLVSEESSYFQYFDKKSILKDNKFNSLTNCSNLFKNNLNLINNNIKINNDDIKINNNINLKNDDNNYNELIKCLEYEMMILLTKSIKENNTNTNDTINFYITEYFDNLDFLVELKSEDVYNDLETVINKYNKNNSTIKNISEDDTDNIYRNIILRNNNLIRKNNNKNRENKQNKDNKPSPKNNNKNKTSHHNKKNNDDIINYLLAVLLINKLS